MSRDSQTLPQTCLPPMQGLDLSSPLRARNELLPYVCWGGRNREHRHLACAAEAFRLCFRIAVSGEGHKD